MAQLVRASDRHSEDPGSNPGWISMSFFHQEAASMTWSLGPHALMVKLELKNAYRNNPSLSIAVNLSFNRT